VNSGKKKRSGNVNIKGMGGNFCDGTQRGKELLPPTKKYIWEIQKGERGFPPLWGKKFHRRL